MGAATAFREALGALEACMARAALAGQEPDGRDQAVWRAVRAALDALGAGGEEAP